MPKTIRQTLLTKLQASQTLAELRADLQAIAGIDLRLVGPTCKLGEVTNPCSDNPLCERVQSTTQGRAHCRRYVEELVIDTQFEHVSCNRCDAGLTGFCVPLRLGGETLGYLLAGGYRTGQVAPLTRNRLRHLLERMNFSEVDDALREFEHETLSVSEAKHEALKRWLRLAADTLIKSLELKNGATDRPLPTFIVHICSVIQRRYQDPPTLRQAAEMCKLSEGYFCRAFHEFTGLRFVEYIHAVRVEHVCRLLNDPGVSVTEAAFAVGFNSLSQFNRVFLKLKGITPRQWRKVSA